MSETRTAQQLCQEAKEAYEREEFIEAANAFERAAVSYQASGDMLSAAEMANNRSVALLQAGEAQAALEAVGNTPETFAEAGDVRRQAMALGNKAAALAALNRTEEAEKLYWESARLLEDIGERELRASVMNSISRLQMRGGRYMEAVASMQSGLEQVKKPNLTQRLLKKLLDIPSQLLRRS